MNTKKEGKLNLWFNSKEPLFFDALISGAKAHLAFLIAGVLFLLFLSISFIIYPDKSLLFNTTFPGLVVPLLGISSQSEGVSFGPSLWYRGAMVVLSSGLFVLFSAWRWAPSIYKNLQNSLSREVNLTADAKRERNKKLLTLNLQRTTLAEFATVFAFLAALSTFALAFFAVDKALYINRLLQAVLGISLSVAIILYGLIYMCMQINMSWFKSFFRRMAVLLLVSGILLFGSSFYYSLSLFIQLDILLLFVSQIVGLIISATALALSSYWSIKQLKFVSEGDES